MEYKPVQKKNSSWTPTTVQKKGKSPGKMGHFSIQPKSNPTSAPAQEIGDYKRASADRLAANVIRGIQAKELELAEGSTLQRKSESPWAPMFDVPPPITQSPASQLSRDAPWRVSTFAPVSENPIQRQCADCAKEEEEQAGEAGKDLEEIGIQTKLTIGAPGDAYEQEADRVASQVMSMSAPPDSSASVQRQLDTNHPHHPHQIWQRAQSITPVVQRQIDPGVQMRQMIQRAHQIDGNQASGDLESRLNASKGGGSPLSEGVRGFMEPRFGADFSSVRVHTGGEAVQMNQELGAQAFTHGSDVYFGQGKEPGNNELTAHELTHVVQQNSSVIQQKSVNEPGWKSPALQMRSQLRTSPLSRLVIQRAVTTSGGEWDTDQYDLVRDSAGGRNFDPSLGVRGVDIKLKFTPGNNVDAELIGLTQSVQAFVNNSASYTNATNKSMSIKSADAIGINTGAGETDEGTAIDRAAPYNNPIYAVQSLPSTALEDTNTAAGWGQNGWHYKNSSGNTESQDATLIDQPRRPNAATDSRHIFETTALATKGVQAGTYYGSVRWGWRTDDQGNFTKIPLSKVSDGVPSSTFMKSAEIWNASKSSTGDDTVDLPIVDVKVTTAPVTLMPPVPLRNIALPVGTRVQIIEEWHPPLLNGTIKVIDGTHTGITGQVSYQEWGNIADERP